jgi:hypothetical protein
MAGDKIQVIPGIHQKSVSLKREVAENVGQFPITKKKTMMLAERPHLLA